MKMSETSVSVGVLWCRNQWSLKKSEIPCSEVLSGDLKLRTGSSDNQIFSWHELGWLQ